MNLLKPVDHSALGVNQAAIIGFLILGYILNLPVLAGFVALVMLLGALLGRPGFGLLYTGLLRPLGWVKPNVLMDNAEPHRFAQGFGGVVVLGGFLLLMAGQALIGWALAWVVVALAALNLFAGFCVGCAVYYWLNRLGLPGFRKSAPQGTFPGLRPRRRA